MRTCDLCQMLFDPTDPLYEHRTLRHSQFHKLAWIQKRNTTQGDPTYV